MIIIGISPKRRELWTQFLGTCQDYSIVAVNSGRVFFGDLNDSLLLRKSRIPHPGTSADPLLPKGEGEEVRNGARIVRNGARIVRNGARITGNGIRDCALKACCRLVESLSLPVCVLPSPFGRRGWRTCEPGEVFVSRVRYPRQRNINH